jgi:hypothetical protein
MTFFLSKEFMKMIMKSKECENNTIKGPLDTCQHLSVAKPW